MPIRRDIILSRVSRVSSFVLLNVEQKSLCNQITDIAYCIINIYCQERYSMVNKYHKFSWGNPEITDWNDQKDERQNGSCSPTCIPTCAPLCHPSCNPGYQPNCGPAGSYVCRPFYRS